MRSLPQRPADCSSSAALPSLSSRPARRRRQTPAGKLKDTPPPPLPPTVLGLEKKVIDAVKLANERPHRCGRVPECNVYVRGEPIGVKWRGRGILLEERGKTIFYPPDQAAFWISWVVVVAAVVENFTCRLE